jgi:hypothetical protein
VTKARQTKARQPKARQAKDKQPEVLLLDVSGMDHPQPFEEVMFCLKHLRKGSYLHMLHRRTPYPLLQILNENGFDFKIIEAVKAEFEALIWKTDDMSTNNYCKKR